MPENQHARKSRPVRLPIVSDTRKDAWSLICDYGPWRSWPDRSQSSNCSASTTMPRWWRIRNRTQSPADRLANGYPVVTNPAKNSPTRLDVARSRATLTWNLRSTPSSWSNRRSSRDLLRRWQLHKPSRGMATQGAHNLDAAMISDALRPEADPSIVCSSSGPRYAGSLQKARQAAATIGTQ